MGMPKK